MKYITYEDLSNIIRKHIWKVPADVDLIVGVQRSGMIAALMIAELLHKRCADLDAFIEGREVLCGDRRTFLHRGKAGKVLVVDDTLCSGNAMKTVNAKLKPIEDRYEIIRCSIFLELQVSRHMVDIIFEDMTQHACTLFFEWNIFHHAPYNMEKSMWDIDGLMCKQPPDDADKEAYEAYLANAIPMVIPSTRIGAIVTYRIEPYRSVTEEWLHKNGVEYGKLFMFPASSREERNRTMKPYRYKANIYKSAQWANLFYESSLEEASNINLSTGKPVVCYEDGNVYI